MRSLRQRLRAVLPAFALACCSLLAPTADAQQPAATLTLTSDQPTIIYMAPLPPRPRAAPVTASMFNQRVLRLFNFEERDVNPEDVPLNWFRAQHLPPDRPRLGFPAFNRAVFDEQIAASGTTSVKLPTRGGSTSLRLAAGAILVFPDAQYRVTANVRTAGLRAARAVLRATMLDEAKVPITSTEVFSDPTITDNAWTPISIDLPGGIPSARFLQLELLLLQPDQLVKLTTGAPRTTNSSAQDIDGAAYFDDVAVLQLPRVSITTEAPGNIFLRPSTPAIILDVRDLSGQELIAVLDVTDLDDRTVQSKRVVIPRGGSKLRTTLDIKQLGWFRVTLRVLSPDEKTSTGPTLATTSLLIIEGPAGEAQGSTLVSPLRPFALFATGLPEPTIAQLPAIAQAVGVSRLTVGLGPGTQARSPTLQPTIEALLAALAVHPAELTIAIEKLPQSITDRLRTQTPSVLALGSVDRADWESDLAAWIGGLGHRVNSWQAGPVLSEAPLNHAAVPGQLLNVIKGLSRVSPGPRVSLPWRADSAWPDFQAAPPPAAAVTLPASFHLEAIAEMLATAAPQARAGTELTYVIEPLDRARFSRRDVIDHWLTRAVETWAQSHRADRALPIARVALWPGLRTSADGLLRPDPLLGPLSTLARMTEGMLAVSPVQAAPGVRGYVLAPEAGSAIGSLNIGAGTMIVWATGELGPTANLTGYFGGGTLTITDPFGNQTSLNANPKSGQHTIAVGTTPSFIQGVDPSLVRFLADIRVNPSFVPAGVGSHDCELILTNPWTTRVSGEITLQVPDSHTGLRRDPTWAISPSAPISFTMPADGSTRIPFNVLFAAAEEAGIKNIALVVRLAADRAYPPMRLIEPFTVGLEDLDLTVTAQNAPTAEGPDVVLTTTVANTGRLTRTLQLTSLAPGIATQTQPIVDLGPGESAVRRFILRDAAKPLTGRRVRILLVDLEGSERMTKYAQVP